jgi:hypothetical protein
LTAQNSLTESPIEKGILHIELLNQLFAGGKNGEHRADGGWLYNGIESLIVVNPGMLRETPEGPASLVAIEHLAGEELVREDSLVGDDIGATGPGISSHVTLLIRVPFSSSIVTR